MRPLALLALLTACDSGPVVNDEFVVEGRAAGETEIDTRTVLTVVVGYAPETDTVTLKALDHYVPHR